MEIAKHSKTNTKKTNKNFISSDNFCNFVPTIGIAWQAIRVFVKQYCPEPSYCGPRQHIFMLGSTATLQE